MYVHGNIGSANARSNGICLQVIVTKKVQRSFPLHSSLSRSLESDCHLRLLDQLLDDRIQFAIVNAALDYFGLAIDDHVDWQIENAESDCELAIQSATFIDMHPRIRVLLKE